MGRASSFTIGKVTGVHGLNGNLKVWSFADSIETFSPGRNVLLKFDDEDGVPYTITGCKPHKKGLMLNLEGITSRDLAERLVGMEITIDREELEEPEEGSWYWEDLIGLAVYDHNKGFIGEVSQIFPTGSNEVLVVTNGKEETLVPMLENFVEIVDIEGNKITTCLPEDY